MTTPDYEPFVAHQADVEAYEVEPGVMFQELVRQQDGARTLIVGLVTFEPAASLPCHMHNVEEVVTILCGEADCVVEGQRAPTRVAPHDASFIPPGVAHRFINASDTDRLVIQYVYTLVDAHLAPVAEVERTLVDSARSGS